MILEVLCWITAYIVLGLLNLILAGLYNKIYYEATIYMSDFWLWPITFLARTICFLIALINFPKINILKFFSETIPNKIISIFTRRKEKQFINSLIKVNKKYGQ